jgi:DNA-binding transcriptional MerR regulator
MKELITIGEIAKLMNVSTHQIRYFEEKGILFPKCMDKNGYRMYGVDEIYTLAHILLLRKINISVADIRTSFNEFSKSDYLSLLTQSIKSMDEQINALIDLRDATQKIISDSNSHDEGLNKFQVKVMKERCLHQFAKIDINASLTGKELFEKMHGISKDINLFEQDMINLYDHKCNYLCMEVKRDSRQSVTHKLIEGSYLCFDFIAIDESNYKVTVSNFFEYAKMKSLTLSGNLIAIENSITSIFYNDGLHVQLQMLIS